MGRCREGGGHGGPDSPGKSQVAIGFLRNTGTDPPDEMLYDATFHQGLHYLLR